MAGITRNPIPFSERYTPLRGPLDLATGRYPSYLFGGPLRGHLPVFHFHEVTLPYLEPYLVYLYENGYQTWTSKEMGEVVRGTRPVKDKAVVLCFDDAWASVWTVVNLLLRRYNMRAITYAIPGRVRDAQMTRPIWGQPGHDAKIDSSDIPFCTWPELRALESEGRVDVQCHTWSHAQIFCSEEFKELVQEDTELPTLSWPLLSDYGEELRFLNKEHLYHPMLPTRSRMSNACKHDVDLSVINRIKDDPSAAPFIFKQHFTQIETKTERDEAIRYELTRSKEELESRLKSTIRQICFPWAVCGSVAERMTVEAGYETAVADRVGGFRACVSAQNPFRIMRLKHQYIRCLPGRSRELYWRIKAK